MPANDCLAGRCLDCWMLSARFFGRLAHRRGGAALVKECEVPLPFQISRFGGQNSTSAASLLQCIVLFPLAPQCVNRADPYLHF